MKKLFYCLVLMLVSTMAIAQTQLSNWFVNGKRLNFLTATPTVTTVFTPTFSSHRGNNCMYDNSGNLICYIFNGYLYNSSSPNAIASVTTQGIPQQPSEYAIIPSPENAFKPSCSNKYFIICNPAQQGTAPPGMFYYIYDANTGQVSSATNLGGQAGSYEFPMAASRIYPNGSRYLYAPGGSNDLNVYNVSSTGITWVNAYSNYPGISPLVGGEMELTNNGDKLAYATGIGNAVVILNIGTNGTPTGVFATFTPSGGGQVAGLEFDNSGNYLFYSMTGGGVYRISLTSLSVPTSPISGTTSYNGMLEKSFNGTQIICGSSSQISSITNLNGTTPTLSSWTASFDARWLPDQIDGENYVPKLVSASGPFFMCKGGTATITVTVPAYIVNQGGYIVEVKDMTTSAISSGSASVSQTFSFTPQVSTQYQVKLYHPANPTCIATTSRNVYVFQCGMVQVQTNNPHTGTARIGISGTSQNPTLEESEGVQTSWMVQEMDPETNEPIATIDNPECWQLPVTEAVTFKGFDADLDYASDPDLFTCDPASPDGSFDMNKNYLVTRASWTTDPSNFDVSGGFIERGVLYEPPFEKRASTGVYEKPTGKNIFTVYPNPGTGMFNITTPTKGSGTIEVYDVLGNRVSSMKLVEGTSGYQLDLSNFPKGMYMVHLMVNNELYQQKIMVK